MRIKLVCIDMDGTIYNKKRVILESTKKALKEAQLNGIKIAIVTGRPLNYIMSYKEQLGDDIIMAGSNGACITVHDTLITHPIKKDELLKIISIIEKYKLSMFVKSLECIFSNTTFCPFGDYEERTKHLPPEYQMKNKIVNDMYTAIKEYPQDIYKMIVLGEDIDIVRKCRKELHEIVEISTFSGEAHHFELTSKDADKGKAVIELARNLKIDTIEVACIGDSNNDIPMFQIAGYRIGMGNANEDICKMSDFITATNENDGVGEALYHIISLK